MSFANYDQVIKDSIDFIRSQRATGIFNFTAKEITFVWTSDDIYEGLSGQVEGNLNGYIENYSELEARVFDLTDVEYIAVWQYEINEPWWNADKQVWEDAWSRDYSVGDEGYISGYCDINIDGSFGGIEILSTKTWEGNPEIGLPDYTAPYKRRILKKPQNTVIRLHRKSDGILLGGNNANAPIWNGYSHITIAMQPDDPQFNGMPPLRGYRINTRSWIYAEALVVLAYTACGFSTEAKKTLQRLVLEQYTEANSPYLEYIGGWPFSFDVYFGRVPEQDYLRNGAIAWVLWAFLIYREKTSDTSFDNTIKMGLEYLLREQINDSNDNRYGLLRLGWNVYNQPTYKLDYLEQSPCSVEHNVDAWQVFSLAYAAFKDERYIKAADLVEKSLLNKALSVDKTHFYQGVIINNIDTLGALDCVTWGGLFAIASQNFAFINKFVDYLDLVYLKNESVQKEEGNSHLNLWYELPDIITGYKPYEYSDSMQPEEIWIEGTLGAIAFFLRIGTLEMAKKGLNFLDNSILKIMYNVSGPTNKGLISITRAYNDWPWEFTIHPLTTNSAWLILVLIGLEMIWTSKTKTFFI